MMTLMINDIIGNINISINKGWSIAMAWLYYVAALSVTAVAFVLFREGGLVLTAGLILGALWRISDRVSRIEARLGMHEPDTSTDEAGYKAEQRRIRNLLGEQESQEQ